MSIPMESPSYATSRVSSLNVTRTEGTSFDMLRTCDGLPVALYDTRVQLHRTHEGMKQLLTRCALVGRALEQCADALATVSATPAESQPIHSLRSNDTHASLMSGTAFGQLHWSLSQFHSRLAQLLSTAHVQTKDTAVATKVARRLGRMEYGTCEFQRAVARTQQLPDEDERCAAIDDAADQLERLATAHFTPAYMDFLLYATATLTDFYDLWHSAAQKGAEEVVWASHSEGEWPQRPSTNAAARRTSQLDKRSASDGQPGHPRRPSLWRRASTSTKASASGSDGAVASHGSQLDSEEGDRAAASAAAFAKLSRLFADAVEAVEALQEALFQYVCNLHSTCQHFSAAAALLSTVTYALPYQDTASRLEGILRRFHHVDDSEPANVRASSAARESSYETVLCGGVLRPLKKLQEDATYMSHRHLHSGALHSRVPSKAGSPTVEAPALRLRLPTWEGNQSIADAASASRSTSRLLSLRPANETACESLEVLFDAWYTLAELCVQVSGAVGESVTAQVEL